MGYQHGEIVGSVSDLTKNHSKAYKSNDLTNLIETYLKNTLFHSFQNRIWRMCLPSPCRPFIVNCKKCFHWCNDIFFIGHILLMQLFLFIGHILLMQWWWQWWASGRKAEQGVIRLAQYPVHPNICIHDIFWIFVNHRHLDGSLEFYRWIHLYCIQENGGWSRLPLA